MVCNPRIPFKILLRQQRERILVSFGIFQGQSSSSDPDNPLPTTSFSVGSGDIIYAFYFQTLRFYSRSFVLFVHMTKFLYKYIIIESFLLIFQKPIIICILTHSKIDKINPKFVSGLAHTSLLTIVTQIYSWGQKAYIFCQDF